MGYSFKKQKSITVVNAFQMILSKSDGKPNKIWLDAR